MNTKNIYKRTGRDHNSNLRMTGALIVYIGRIDPFPLFLYFSTCCAFTTLSDAVAKYNDRYGDTRLI